MSLSWPVSLVQHILSPLTLWLNISAWLTSQTCWNLPDIIFQSYPEFSQSQTSNHQTTKTEATQNTCLNEEVGVGFTPEGSSLRLIFLIFPSLCTPVHLKASFLKWGQILVYARTIRHQWSRVWEMQTLRWRYYDDTIKPASGGIFFPSKTSS